MTVSAQMVQSELLAPAMDATALNRLQSRLLYDPSPETDSLIELLCEGLRDGAQAWELAALDVGRRLFESNRDEGDQVRAITGRLDGWASALHAERLAGSRPVLGAKAIRERVRAPLGVLQGQHTPVQAADAVRAIDAATCGYTVSTLPGSLISMLGPRKHELLCELVARRGAVA